MLKKERSGKGVTVKVFNVGDKVVYPMHGAGIIQSIEEKNILGAKESYYIITHLLHKIEYHYV